MASPGGSSEKNVQEQGQDAGASGGNAPESPQPGGVDEQGDGSGVADAEKEGAREVPASESGVVVAAPGEGPGKPEKKRGRKDEPGASSSAGEKKRKKGELLEIPSKPPSCYVCGRSFHSWKAVFGHMRAHKVGEERARGAFPPPVFTPPDGSPVRDQQALQQQLAPTLLNIAQDVLLRPGQEGQSSSTRGLNIDLNLPQESSSSSSSSAPSSPDKDSSGFDLNMPPPEEGSDDDADAGDGGAA